MAIKMGRAAVLTKTNADLEILEYPLPKVGKGAILVKITCCTICGSDVHAWSGKRKAPVPMILGHEIVGKVLELGEGAAFDSGDRGLKVGDRITWTIMDNCGKCYYCREKGLMMKCLHLKKYGHDRCTDPPHFIGGFAEYCYLTPGTCVIKVPDELTDEEAAPANCALATVVAGWEAADLKPFENVLIQGAGALGFYAAALAKHHGCRRIIVTDILDHRLATIREFGATDTINTRHMGDDELVRVVQDLTDGFGVDAAMEIAGAPGIVPVGLKCLRMGGRYIDHGIVFAGANVTIDFSEIVFRCLTVRGIHNYDTRHLQAAIDFLAQTKGTFPFHKLVTDRFCLDEINQAMTLAHSGNAIRVAVIP
ncbi:MAG: zinc-binding dehydrogenase [Deltaproteobacteria bacterium]